MEYDIDDRYTLRDVKVAGTEEEKQKLVKTAMENIRRIKADLVRRGAYVKKD